MYFSGGTTLRVPGEHVALHARPLDGSPLIVLRERFMVQKIDATDMPIVCLPKVAHLMPLETLDAEDAAAPGELRRRPRRCCASPPIKHAFINHGESDKLSSCNPYAKAYDEVWVAGPAARERYALADVGVEDKDVVEVGRPQLAPIRPYAGPPTGTYTTVLYAPTWEGWDGNPGNTSVVLAGENIVRELLADAKVRLLYKPHPMTGSVDPRAGAANERIKAMIREANTEARRAPRPRRRRPRPNWPAYGGAGPADHHVLPTSADEMERMLLQGTPSGDRAAAIVPAATAAWEKAYWASLPGVGAPGSSPRPRPAIFACFNQADLLISDVSQRRLRLPDQREAVRGRQHQRADRRRSSARPSRRCARRRSSRPRRTAVPALLEPSATRRRTLFTGPAPS